MPRQALATLQEPRPHLERAVQQSVVEELRADPNGLRNRWYLADEVLDVLAMIQRDPPALVRNVVRYVQTADEWVTFESPAYASLLTWQKELGPYSMVFACDVAAAVTGLRLRGVHFKDDEPRLVALSAEIEAAFQARMERAA